MKRIALGLGLALSLAACHHASTPAPAAHAEGHSMADELKGMPPEVAKFHDILAPRWHAEKGAQRTKDTCAAVADFTTSADALAKTTAPANTDAAKWTAMTHELVTAVAALHTTCEPLDDAKFEEAFLHVHEGFHHVLEAGGMKMEGHMEGHEMHDEGHEHEHSM